MTNPGAPGARRAGVIAVLAGATLWGTIGTSYALIQERVTVDDVTLVTLRAGGAAAIVIAWLLASNRSAFAIRSADAGRRSPSGPLTQAAWCSSGSSA